MSPRRATRAAAFAALALAWSCGRHPAPPPAPPQAAPAPAPETLHWTWHPLGGVAVIEGEVKAPTDLVLEGPSIRESRFAEPGPVRWEFYRPPEGETAVLRTASGQILARFVFSTRPQAAPSAPPRPKPAPRAIPAPAPPPPARPVPRPAPVPQPAPVPAPAPAQLPPSVTSRARILPSRQRALPRRGAPPTLRPDQRVPVVPAPRKPWSVRLPVPAPKSPAPKVPVPRAPALERPQPGAAGPWPGMGEGFNLTRGPRTGKQMLLSFDGGSGDEVATEILDTLKARGVHTTFFLTGQFIRRYPEVVRRMVAEGHEIGNHTMDHPHFAPGMRRDPAWTKARIQKELLDADAEMLRVTGRPMDPYWRAPYGEETPEIRRWAEEVGYRHVGWSEGADSLDWATTATRGLYHSGPAIIARLERRLDHDANGLIVLMHLGSGRPTADRPAEKLGAFMDRARAEGWTFVNAGTFFRELGKPVWDPRRRLALLTQAKPARVAGPR